MRGEKVLIDTEQQSHNNCMDIIESAEEHLHYSNANEVAFPCWKLFTNPQSNENSVCLKNIVSKIIPQFISKHSRTESECQLASSSMLRKCW